MGRAVLIEGRVIYLVTTMNAGVQMGFLEKIASMTIALIIHANMELLVWVDRQALLVSALRLTLEPFAKRVIIATENFAAITDNVKTGKTIILVIVIQNFLERIVK